MIEVRIISDHAAVAMLKNFIRSLIVYKHAEDYVQGQDSFYVESFNNVCLIDLQGRTDPLWKYNV
jgi:sRNA-binding regulator protein Hfq